jgi:hypothetical protein
MKSYSSFLHENSKSEDANLNHLHLEEQLAVSKDSPWFFRLKQIWQWMGYLLLDNQEPKIYHRRDRHGNSYLKVYDPKTGQSAVFNTSHEVRIWLEKRYYR